MDESFVGLDTRVSSLCERLVWGTDYISIQVSMGNSMGIQWEFITGIRDSTHGEKVLGPEMSNQFDLLQED